METILVAIGGTVATLLVPSIGKFSAGLKTAILDLKAMTLTASSAQLAIGALTIAITGVMMFYAKLQQQKEEEARKRRETIDSAKEEIETIKSALETLNNEKLTRQQLDEVVAKNLSSYTDEISKISELNGAREEAIGLLQAESKAKAEQALNEGYLDYLKAEETLRPTGNENDTIANPKAIANTGGKYGLTLDDGTEIETETLSEYVDELDKALKKYIELDDGSGKYAKQISSLTKILGDSRSAEEESNKALDERVMLLAIAGRKMTDEEQKRYDAIQKSKDATQDAKNANEDYSDSEEESVDATEQATAEIEAQEQAYQDATSATSNIISSISQLSDAYQEQAENGELSIDTQLKLIDSGYALALQYDATTGACTLNKEAMIQLVQAKIQEQIANLTLLRTNLADKMRADANVALQSAGAFLALANAKGSALTNLTKGSGGTAQQKSQLASYDAQIKVLQNSLKSVKTAGVGAFGGIAKSAKSAGGATKATTSAVEEQKKALEKLKSNYEKAISYIKKKLDEDIDKLEEDKDKALENVDAKIDALNKQRDAEEKYWDDKIDALEEQNDELEKQIELENKLEALAKAKATKVMVYKGGQWVYGSDESEVSKAEQELYDYQESLKREAQLKALQDMKDKVLANLDAQIQGWEDYKDQLEKNYNDQIEKLEAFKDRFDDMVNSYEDSQNKLLAEQLTGINFEKGNWDTRLGNLQNFVNSYNSILAQLDSFDDTAVGDTGGGGGGGGASSGGGTTTTPTAKKINGYKGSVKYTGKYPITYNGSTYRTGQVATFKGGSPQDVASQIASFIRSAGKSFASQVGGITAYASGVGSIGSDQVALVGDSPNKNQELVLGSKANGQLMNLAKGSGVINNSSLKSFAGLVNAMGKYSSINGSTSGTLSNMSSNTTNNNGLTINNLTIQANNPNEFEAWAKRYNSNMLRMAY